MAKRKPALPVPSMSKGLPNEVRLTGLDFVSSVATGRTELILPVSLSRNGHGLLVRTASMNTEDFWHVHNDEMSPFQRLVHAHLTAAKNQRSRRRGKTVPAIEAEEINGGET